jgi:hypothetical protein
VRPGTASIHAECLEPFRRWRLRGEVTGQRTTRADMLARRAPEGDAVEVAIDLEVTAATPLWAIGYDDGSTPEEQGNRGFRTHHHQLMMTSGSITLPSGATQLSGPTWRDHSRGPRTLTTWSSHALVGAWFPQSGRGVGLIRQFDASGAARLDAAYIVENGSLTPARVISMTPLEDVSSKHDEVKVVVRAEDGGDIELNGRVVTQTLGPIGSASWISEAQTQWVLDGEVSYGLCERSVRAED